MRSKRSQNDAKIRRGRLQETVRMVNQCVLDRRIDKLEEIADEVIGVQPIQGATQDRLDEEDYSLTKPP